MENEEVNILEFLKIINKWKKMIIGIFIISLLFVSIVSLFIPKAYESNALILLEEPEDSKLSLTQNIPSFLLNNKLGSSNSDIFDTILKSKTIAKYVIEKGQLETEYPNMKDDDLIGLLAGNISIKSYAALSNIKVVTYESDTPLRAYKILSLFLSVMEEYNQNTKITKASKTRVFVEGRLKKVKEELDELDTKIINYKQANKLIGLETQTEGTTKILSAIEAQIVTLEVQLRNELKTKSERHPDIIELRKNLENLNNKYYQALTGYAYRGDSSAADFPQKVVDLEKLMSQREIKKQVISMLSQELEKAKIYEKKKEISFTAIDPPEIPKIKSKPQRRKIIYLTSIVSIIVGVLGSFMLEFYYSAIKPQLKIFKRI